MHSPRAQHLRRVGLPMLAVALVAAAALVAVARAAENNGYVVHTIVSNVPNAADHLDPTLQNGWGLDSGPTTPPGTCAMRSRPFGPRRRKPKAGCSPRANLP